MFNHFHLLFLLFLVPVAIITWDNIHWKFFSDKTEQQTKTNKFDSKEYEALINKPTRGGCLKFLYNHSDMKNESRKISNLLDSLVLSEYVENDTDLIRLAYFVYRNHDLSATPTIERINIISQNLLEELWKKEKLLEPYGMPNYSHLPSFLSNLNLDYAWRMVQFTKDYEGFREKHPNSIYDKIAYRRFIEMAIEAGEYEEMKPLHKISDAKGKFANIIIDNHTSYTLKVSYLSIKNLNFMETVSISAFNKKSIRLLAGDYKVYACTEEKNNVTPYASKYRNITAGDYEEVFVIKQD